MNVDEMPAGREMDVLVGKIMGWEIKLMPYAYANLPNDWHCRADHDGRWLELPHFSTDIAAAWRLAVSLREQRTYLEIWCDSSLWVALFWYDGDPLGGPRLVGRAEAKDDVPLAICRAALKAIEGSNA